MMTAAQSEIPVTERVRSLEVRWILPGQLESAVAGWFARFPAGAESREDIYLADPPLRRLSVKLRRGRALEVKVYQGSPGTLEVTGRPRPAGVLGQMVLPCDMLVQAGTELPGWRPVHKLIRRFSLASVQRGACVPGPAGKPGCKVELTEVRLGGQAWWTLGFEATGPASLLRGELEATAALVFAQALPGGVELGTDDSHSYAQWLSGLQPPSDTSA